MALAGKVCVVTGASRGIGKGIALQLGEAGATVYITGRTLRPTNGAVGGSLAETADEIEKRGGKCIAVQCDHSNDKDIKALFDQIAAEQNGRIDVLVNNAYTGVQTIIDNLKTKFWESDPAVMWDTINNVGLRNHYICAAYAARLMIPRKSGLIINVSSLGGLSYIFNAAYGIGKEACDRMAADCAVELRHHNIAFISLWPGAIKTEVFVNAVRDSSMKVEFLDRAATTEYVGKVVVQLCKEPSKQIMQRSGKIIFADDIADYYRIKDIDGTRPASMRSLPFFLTYAGYKGLARWIPAWFKVPLWIFGLRGSKL